MGGSQKLGTFSKYCEHYRQILLTLLVTSRPPPSLRTRASTMLPVSAARMPAKLRKLPTPTAGKVEGSTRQFFTRTTAALSTSTLTTPLLTTATTTTTRRTSTSLLTTTATTTTTTTLPPPVPSSHLFLILGLLLLIGLLIIGFGVNKTLYQKPNRVSLFHNIF